MKYLGLCVVAVLLPVFLLQPAFAEKESYPIITEPSGIAENLGEPSRSLHNFLAAGAHEAQIQQLDALRQNEAPWHCCFVLGVAFALEEYCLRELTFPDSAEKLYQSGYLIDGWSDDGLKIVDFRSEEINSYDDRTLIYAPQPFGDARMIRVPGRPCGVTMLSLSEYSLLIPEEYKSIWETKPEGPATNWVEPYLAFALFEITHVNSFDPGRTRCALS